MLWRNLDASPWCIAASEGISRGSEESKPASQDIYYYVPKSKKKEGEETWNRRTQAQPTLVAVAEFEALITSSYHVRIWRGKCYSYPLLPWWNTSTLFDGIILQYSVFWDLGLQGGGRLPVFRCVATWKCRSRRDWSASESTEMVLLKNMTNPSRWERNSWRRHDGTHIRTLGNKTRLAIEYPNGGIGPLGAPLVWKPSGWSKWIGK